ncbi:TORTIFOLIA1-like protein 5 [Tasmannia lanceolata]|uniref:TORTIFOLIA1-like protein 5 n=1 Tax=Tasmannia lanceolata TaxID=3420 RepID=UPI0040627CDC
MALSKPTPTIKRSTPSPPQNSTSTRDLKKRVIISLNKLSDRDTHAIASSELESIAQNLTSDSFSPFLSCIYETDSSQKSPVRRQCVRLLSVLSDTHGNILTPFLPRMVGNLIRRLRDPDSAVRSACVEAVSVMASRITKPSFTVFLKPLSETLILEQDYNSQIGSALCLSSAIEAAPDPDPVQLQRLLPRFIKLLKSDSFKAKPALISLIASIVGVGGASSSNLLGLVIPCLLEFLSSEDWAARKAAAEAFARMAVRERNLLSEFKSSCISSFETRRFDKVKIVRDSMNRMLDAWKDIPSISDDVSIPAQSISSSRDIASDGRFPTASKSSDTLKSDFPFARKKSPISRSSQPDNASAATIKNGKERSTPALFRKLDHKKPSDWKIQIAVPQRPFTDVSEDKVWNSKGRDVSIPEQNETSRCSKPEVKRALFDKNCDEMLHKFGGLKSASRVVPFHEKESLESTVVHSNNTEEFCEGHKDSDLSLIRKQLVQIENQQSSLLDLLERFIGNSQNGMRSLETRVHGLEMALDEISHDLAVSTKGMTNTDTAGNTCCKLPGAEFLSSKFWRRTEGRYSGSRFSTSGISSLAADSYKLENRRFGLQGGFVVNPIAEAHSQSIGCSEVGFNRTLKIGLIHETEGRKGRDKNRRDEGSSVS